MRIMFIVAAAVCWASVGNGSASGQPILDRVEQLLRRQITAPANSGATAREPGYLGLLADDRGEQGRGVRVLEVTRGGPADTGGVRPRDLITAIGGRPIRAMDDMVAAVSSQTAGTPIDITVERGGATAQHQVTLGRRPQSPTDSRPVENLPPPPTTTTDAAAEPPGPRLGVRTADVSEEIRLRNNLADHGGATVVYIAPGSGAARAGVPLGAVITAVDGRKVNSPQELAAAIRGAAGNEVALTYVAGGQPVEQPVSLSVLAKAEEPPKLELRARPVQPAEPQELPAPATVQSSQARIEALEARIRELEARVEKLEAARADE